MNNSETLTNFHKQNKKATEVLQSLKKVISEGIDLGLTMQPSVLKKIDRVAEMVGDDQKLKVALIGGFSEGKTSIAAAWMGKIDKKTMKIAQQESSDEVNVYDVDSDIQLIDTPGLFGFKEKYNEEEKNIEKYKDITKRYVSEAHLVLYVMDSTNPIKASHKDDLVWLFRDLNLLPRTVFVLSRFDEVTDVEDEWEYRETLKVKQENVIGRLQELIGLTKDEQKQMAIVGVAANPFGKGIEYWLDNMDELKELSKIESLQKATAKTIESNGGYFPIVYDMQKSVINDIMTNNIEMVKSSFEEIDEVLAKYKETIADTKGNIEKITTKGINAQSALIKFVTKYFGGLKAQIRGCGMDTLQSFLDAEIGKEGAIMYAKIQNQFNTQLNSVATELNRTVITFDGELQQFDSTMEVMGKKGIEFMRNGGVAIDAQLVKGARDGIVGAGKMIGVDLGNLLKFKPWGAVNLANNLCVAFQFVGVIFDLWEAHKKREAEAKFREIVNGLISDFDKTQAELLERLQGDDFLGRFFPEYSKLKNKLDEGLKCISVIEEKKEKIQIWCNECKKISDACASL